MCYYLNVQFQGQRFKIFEQLLVITNKQFRDPQQVLVCGVICDRGVQRLTLILQSCSVSSLQLKQWARFPVISRPFYFGA